MQAIAPCQSEAGSLFLNTIAAVFGKYGGHVLRMQCKVRIRYETCCQIQRLMIVGDLSGVLAMLGQDQRHTGFIDEHAVRFVYDGHAQAA